MDANRYKQAMRQYATGVMVLTVRDGEGFHAVTVNSVSSVSLNPTMLLVCLEKDMRSHQLVHSAGTFALSILSAQQVELGKQFAYDRAARSQPQALAAHRITTGGELVLEHALGYFECEVAAEYPGGDHTIFLAEVSSASTRDTDAGPLLYYQSRWLKLEP